MQIKVLEPVVADEIPLAEPVDQDTDDDIVNTGDCAGSGTRGFATQTIYQGALPDMAGCLPWRARGWPSGCPLRSRSA